MTHLTTASAALTVFRSATDVFGFSARDAERIVDHLQTCLAVVGPQTGLMLDYLGPLIMGQIATGSAVVPPARLPEKYILQPASPPFMRPQHQQENITMPLEKWALKYDRLARLDYRTLSDLSAQGGEVAHIATSLTQSWGSPWSLENYRDLVNAVIRFS